MIKRLKGIESEEDKALRRSVKKQYVYMSKDGYLGINDPRDYIATVIIGMYDKVELLIEQYPGLLKSMLEYMPVNCVPGQLNKSLVEYVEGKITKKQAKDKLSELKSKTELYLIELGANPNNTQIPTGIYPSLIPDAERDLEARIIADSMNNDGTIDHERLFREVADMLMYNQWVKLYKKIGERKPTFEEFILEQNEAYKLARKHYPELGDFKDDSQFESWVSELEKNLGQNKIKAFNSLSFMYEKVVELYKKKQDHK